MTGILDYLSYTTKICQLVQRFNLISVLLYDREYRKLQSVHSFRWGTDVPHLQSVHLQPRQQRALPHSQGKGSLPNGSKPAPQQGPFTLDGKTICKLFNTKGGCRFQNCKYAHECSQPGCHQSHSAVAHQTKNG